MRKAEQDFEISTAEEYLEGERSENINIKKVAHLWELAGVSYYIYPQNKFNDESETFITLAIAVCIALEGTFFVQDYSWNKPNLRTPSDLLTQFIERNH
ncbi:hypothetical protein [Lysobacter capsici]|uniref:hypothetical protein n=1 Tax=Lysobacter capsici TaxID=435897 RepID=UPI00287BC3E0|nr:hypothetical protein [Lysobacter capsici]WND87211.1 hypothetical protein RJ609_06550 [Lysobacter capsici]